MACCKCRVDCIASCLWKSRIVQSAAQAAASGRNFNACEADLSTCGTRVLRSWCKQNIRYRPEDSRASPADAWQEALCTAQYADHPPSRLEPAAAPSSGRKPPPVSCTPTSECRS